MTKKKAKEIGLETWGYLYEHPEIDNKEKLPVKLWNKIKTMNSYCSLCELYNINIYNKCSEKCPLYCNYEFNGSYCPHFEKWRIAITNRSRKKQAKIIYDLIFNWEI